MLNKTDILLSGLLDKIATAAMRRFSEDERLDFEYTLRRVSGGLGTGRSAVTSGLKVIVYTKERRYVIEASTKKLDVAVVEYLECPRGRIESVSTAAKLELSGLPLERALEVAGSMDETKDYPFLAEVFS